MISAFGFANAFERNCPHVRMSKDEHAELGRLFFVAQKHWQDAIRQKPPSEPVPTGDEKEGDQS